MLLISIKEPAPTPLQPPAAKPVTSALRIAGSRDPSHFLTPQHRTNAGQHLSRIEGLYQIIVRAELKSDNPVDFIGAVPAHDNHRHVRTRANVPQELQAVVMAEPEVEHDKAGIHAFKIPI